MTKIIRCVLGCMALLGCAGVSPKAINDWATPNFPQYRKLVEKQYSEPSTRANAYGSMATLICLADTADKHTDSVACKCQQAASDADKVQQCDAFIQSYPAAP